MGSAETEMERQHTSLVATSAKLQVTNERQVAGVFLSSVVIIALALFSPQREGVLKTSVLAPYVIEFSSVMVKLVPSDLREEFLKKYDDMKRHEEKENSASL